MSLPKISIVMPILNSGQTLDKALRSVVQQNYPYVELIILDGGSRDNTLSILQQYENHISFWRSVKDQGPVAAMNEGIQKATGDLIAILMGDDWYEPGVFHAIAASYQANSAEVYTCGGRLVRAVTKEKYAIIDTYLSKARMAMNVDTICFDITSAICCRFIKKSVYERLGYFDEKDHEGKHIFSNDKIFLLRSYFAGVKAIFVPYLGHNYLAHAGSSTFGKNRENIRRLCEEHMMTVDMFLQQGAGTFLDKCKLNYFHMDQSTRLFLFRTLDRNWHAAGEVLKSALKRNPIIWPLVFPWVFLRILTKKTLRGVKRLCFKPTIFESL